ncbi:DUF2520 domain-containing protein [Alloprevotella sp. OH1205_COT-284]|uniref:Rossmann-like and DUF2520 domain-containing protein n=1 Tax=Alloprevotella sp. OH1205_COT-284 TaxID=2491043 RepID=UPI000F5DD7AD|nr:Rossmann-like and DUF2520 domain-containing protein [Alloprevotella sp. OH1205_COT-284]RRD77401.1 DUF2520 domain-containing protein [Alloprevotella sp. OH1205_COT-284]
MLYNQKNSNFAIMNNMPSSSFHEIVMIGAGNLATHLSWAFTCAGHSIKGVYSRSLQSAEMLAKRNGRGCVATNKLQEILQADIYVIAVTDTALSQIISSWPEHCKGGVVLHTSGSVPMSLLKEVGGDYGVLYPLQTFSKQRKISFSDIPCFVEGNSPQTTDIIVNLANTISQTVHFLDSHRRKRLHLAAVFACNFVNHLYDLASELLKDENLDPQWLQPLIRETADKINSLSPRQAQTGPALRADKKIMTQHLGQLDEFPELQSIYKSLSNSIYNTFHGSYDKL